MTKPDGPVLRGEDYFVADISQTEALELVTRYHYARGGSNTAIYRHGLFHRDSPDVPLGVAWWLPPTKVAAQSVSPHWQGVLTLTRLVVHPDVPQNGATFLLGRSIRRIRNDRRWHTLLTYADSGQGHDGTIYRASNWEYLGLRKGHPVWMDDQGRHVAKKAGPKTRTNAEMLALGYVNMGNTDKHKFVLRILNPSQTPIQKRIDRR